VGELRLVKIRQRFPAPTVSDVHEQAKRETKRIISSSQLTPGSRVAITAGSRGIGEAVEVYRGAVEAIEDAGHLPFLFASMGSHGRGEASGQRDLLTSLSVTEEKVGAPVSCSGETVEIGETTEPVGGLPVYVMKEAHEADAVLVVNRIKPHTSFHGLHESGLIKMLAVGMGGPSGASMVHSLGWNSMEAAIESIAAAVMEKLPVIGGLAVVENAQEGTAVVEGLLRKGIPSGETRLLEKARALMPSLPAKNLDLCVVKEMGKNYSGTGMDTNIIGRLRLQGMPEPREPYIQYLAVLDLSEASHGNATGVGLADFTTQRLAEKIDRNATYLNCLVSGGPIRAAVPMTLPNDEELFRAVWTSLKPDDMEEVRAMVIENTLHLEEVWVSEALLPEIEEIEGVELVGKPEPLQFDEEGRIVLP
jgi:hypothetical protein